MTPVLRFDDRVTNALVQVKVNTGKSWSTLLRAEGRLACVRLAHSTQPFGNDASAHDQGKIAVKRDVGKVYATGGEIYDELKQQDENIAKAFYAAMERGDLTAARVLLAGFGKTNRNTPIGIFDGGAAHRRNRNSRGKISRRRAELVVGKYRPVENYIKARWKRVGFAKAGWAACAKQLGGTRGIAGWISRAGGVGSVDDKSNLINNPRITVTNEVRYVSDCLDSRQAFRAIQISGERIIKQAGIIVSNAARKAGL